MKSEKKYWRGALSRLQSMVRLLFFGSVAFGFIAVAAQSEDTVATVEDIIIRFQKEHRVPGMAVALYVHGKPYLFHLGYADKSKKIPVASQTLFEIGSISKIFTCLLVGQEIVDGYMQLGDPIGAYIPSLAKNKHLKGVTLETLATHTSALPFNAPMKITSTDSLINYTARWRPGYRPAIQWHYSNYGIELLRVALEEYEGVSYNQLLIDKVLAPLGMAPVGIEVPLWYRPHYAACYGKNGAQTIHWRNPILLGSAALRVSSADMLKFLKAAIGLPGTPTNIKLAMKTTQTPCVSLNDAVCYGLGWQVNDLEKFRSAAVHVCNGCPAKKISGRDRIFDGHALFDKTGTTEGFHAYIAVVPSGQVGVVVMINRTLYGGSKMVKRLGKEILAKTWM